MRRPVSVTATLAADMLRRSFPQALITPWRGSDGADCNPVTVNHGIVHVSLRKDRGLWWAEASGRRDFKTIELFASSASEAAEKLKRELNK